MHPAALRAVREKEQQRPPNGLVKVVCLPFDGAAEQKHGRKKATDARFETMIGPISWVDSLFIWFPAAWMPLVVDAIREKSYMHIESTRQLGAGGCPTYSLPVTNTLSHCCQLQSSPEPFILLPGPVLPGNKGKHWVGGGPYLSTSGKHPFTLLPILIAGVKQQLEKLPSDKQILQTPNE